ncbi:MAG: hypothetical protein COB15_03435 [Flavobacteriales bacterium]|nr:MAG: hypothetical protein COB15_03435 [Flavobacteriales bacterium]
MKQLLALLFLFITVNSNAQTTAIPDANFELRLISQGLDVVLDGQVLTANIDTVTYVDLGNNNISDLTGIEDFTALIHLDCEVNNITTLDMSQNLSLKIFEANSNQLTSIDISQNLQLEFFDCAFNFMTTLDLSHLPNLKTVHIDSNLLTCLNLKNGNNLNMFPIYAENNQFLICVEVDSVALSNLWVSSGSLDFEFDSQVNFSTNCNNTCSVGVKENRLSNLSIYPNPTNGSITINLEGTKSNIQIQLTNSIGQAILTKYYKSANHINIDIDAPKGLYFLKLESNGEVITKKIIKE